MRCVFTEECVEDFEDKYPSCFNLNTNMDSKLVSVSSFDIALETQFSEPSNVIDTYCSEKAMQGRGQQKAKDSSIIATLKSQPLWESLQLQVVLVVKEIKVICFHNLPTLKQP